jgi:hypothetical protein
MEHRTESFIRWQGRAIEELGKTIHFLLALALTTIGFIASVLLDEKFTFKNACAKQCLAFGSIFLLACTVVLLLLILNRLSGIRQTTKIARKRETEERDDIETLRSKVKAKDKLTWILFKISVFIFMAGEILIIIAFLNQVSDKF